MLRRSLPFVLLLAALAALAWWAWPRAAAGYHARRVFALVRQHRERQGPAWPEADARRLWASIRWFAENDVNGFRRRLLEGVESEEPELRQAAAVLCAEIQRLENFVRSSSAQYFPGKLPMTGDIFEGTLDRFRIAMLAESAAPAFARLATDASLESRRALLYLAWAADAAELGVALEAIAATDASTELRVEAVRLLGRPGPALSTLRLLHRLRGDPEPLLRWCAALALARVSDPEGTRAFVEALCLPHPTLPPGHLPLRPLLDAFPSLQEAVLPTSEWLELDRTPGAGLPCDLQAAWRAWLELRESEGFAAEAQRARDEAYEEPEPSDWR